MAQNKLRIKKGDHVIVVAGKDKGKTGDVVKVLREENRVIVSGINIVKKHEKPSMASAGGIVQKEASLHVSNVALVDPKTSKPTRVGYKILDNGEKVRIAKRSGEVIG